MDYLNSATASLIPVLVSTITKHAAYPFNASSNVKDLQAALRDLVALKKDVTTTIENAEREHGVPTKSAEEWLNQVEKIETEAEHIFADYQQRRRCLWNHSADVWSNYKISRRATKQLAQVKSLCEKQTNLEVTKSMPPPLRQELPASLSKSPSLESALHEINHGVHNVVGIWGKGGIGKTHLLNQVNNELSKSHELDAVIFVTCSKDCSEEKVQDVIISKLGLDKTPELKQNTIYNFLIQRNFVLLLDDLWSRIDIDKVGIPNPISTTGSCKRKIVLTTRSKDVCRDMEVRKIIPVDVLKWDQAWSLFVSKVTEDTIMSHPIIREYAIKVAKELGGLPLALITVGRAMHDKRKPSDWENALKLLKRAGLDDVLNESVFHTLSFSYENLRNEKLKECFLHCSLWPEDENIRWNDLVELWMGVGLIDEPDDIQSAYNVGYTYIEKLQDVCLLEEGDPDDPSVKMHDVMRDMALWIANDRGSKKNKWIVQPDVRHGQIDVPSETETLSIHKCQSVRCSSGSPMLSTLRIYDVKSLQIGMFLGIVFLDLQKGDLDDFPMEICKLVKLEFLNISRNYDVIVLDPTYGITSLPKDLAALVNLRYLFLRGHRVSRIPYGIMSKLKALRVLDMSTDLEQQMEDISWLEELKLLGNFQALGIKIKGGQQLEKLLESNVPVRWLKVVYWDESPLTISDSFFGDSQMQTNLFSLSIEIRRNVSPTGETQTPFLFESKTGGAHFFERLEEMYYYSMVGHIDDILWVDVNPKDLFSRLRHLQFYWCNGLTSISWVVYCPCLLHLTVACCYKMRQLVNEEYLEEDGDGEIQVSCPTFPFLQTLELYELSNLGSICGPKITFPALEKLQVIGCRKLRKLPFKADTIPSKLKQIKGEKEWWDNIEWEDSSLRSSLQPYFVVGTIYS